MKLLLVFVFAFLSSCASHRVATVTKPMLVAHRGSSKGAPENTLAAFDLAWRENADAVEGDFYLTKDGAVICLHDGTFKRTAGVNKRPIDLTLKEIKKLDVGRWKNKKFVNETVPTLSIWGQTTFSNERRLRAISSRSMHREISIK
jgi:glycerophosphoryl diester phosphodiesterase